MQRLATTVAIAAWIGFLGVFAIELLADAFAPDLLAGAKTLAWPPALAVLFDGFDATVSGLAPRAFVLVAVLCLAVVGLLASGLFFLQAKQRSGIARGETLVLAGIGCIALMAAVAQLTAAPLLPIDLDGGLVWLAVALSIAAVAFDRLVAIETAEEVEAESEFQDTLALLVQQIGRQAALYPLPEPGSAEAGKDSRP